MNYDKLNELAATRVMGWKLEVIREPNFSYEGYEDIQYWQPGNGEGLIKIESWSPATDVNDAIEVMEKFTDGESWDIQAFTTLDIKKPNVLRCWSVSYGGFPSLIERCDHSLSLAITLCALHAAGVSEYEIASALSTSEGEPR